jgi:hypothetical protein
MRNKLNHRDVLFIVETLMPGRADREHIADRLTADEAQLETMLDDNRLFQRLGTHCRKEIIDNDRRTGYRNGQRRAPH